jgi:hypothetical protein
MYLEGHIHRLPRLEGKQSVITCFDRDLTVTGINTGDNEKHQLWEISLKRRFFEQR